jgi:hypothetical protein
MAMSVRERTPLVFCALSSILCGGLFTGCGETVRPIGVLVNRIGISKELMEAAAGPPPPMPVDVPGRSGNVIGDSVEDRLAAMSGGRGVEIRDGSSAAIVRIPMDDYLTDLALIRGSDAIENDVVVLTYPNAKRGGTISVFRLPETTPKATWEEMPSPGRLAVGVWAGEPAVFYERPDAFMVRAVDGRVLAQLGVPGAGAFRLLNTAAIDGGRTVVVASGDGYTPYHMVAVWDGQRQLLFHEQADEHAWQLTVGSDGKSFEVHTRSKRWRYTMN